MVSARLLILVPITAIALGSPTFAQPTEPGFQVSPTCPTPDDTLAIQATYFTNCLHEGRLERRGDTLRVVAMEGCACPASPDELTTVTVQSEPLLPGNYDLELVVERRESGQICPPDPVLIFRDRVLVSTSGKIRSLRTVPERPRVEEAVTLELEVKLGENFFLVDSVNTVDRTIQIEVSPCLLSNCPPEEFHSLELGGLSPGRYTVVVVSELQGDSGPLPILEVPFTFRVGGTLSLADRRSPRGAHGALPVKRRSATEPFTVTPPHPRWKEAFEVTTETFLDCPVGQRAEVVGSQLRLILERDCGCPPAIPVPVTARGTFDPSFAPLPPGLYQVVLAIQDVGEGSLGGRPCEEQPELLNLGPVLLSGSGGMFSAGLTFLDPGPEAGALLDLTFSPRERGFFSEGQLAGPLLRVLEKQPPRSPQSTFESWRVPLVPLGPGEYSTVILGAGPQDLPILEAVIPFRIPPVRP